MSIYFHMSSPATHNILFSSTFSFYWLTPPEYIFYLFHWMWRNRKSIVKSVLNLCILFFLRQLICLLTYAGKRLNKKKIGLCHILIKRFSPVSVFITFFRSIFKYYSYCWICLCYLIMHYDKDWWYKRKKQHI